MANLLYNWYFTNDNTITNALNNFIYDSISNLSAKVISRDTISSSTVSIDDNGINLNNTDTDGGIYIDLIGLDTTQYGNNITIITITLLLTIIMIIVIIVMTIAVPRQLSAWGFLPREFFGKGLMGSALMGSLQV